MHTLNPESPMTESAVNTTTRPFIRSTTVICIRKGPKVAIAGDGQVTLGNATIVKHKAMKIRRLYNDTVLTGFAGAAADAFTLLSRFESKLEQYSGQLDRAAVELAKDWRTDKFLRQLEALLIVADRKQSLLISGTGEIIEPDDGIIAIGSGGPYSLAAARALMGFTDLEAPVIAREALRIASQICVYTNENIVLEEL